jgi:hypothetical protein
MISDHDIELHLAHWRKAVDGNLKNGRDPAGVVVESADEIKELLKDTAEKARAAIDRASKLSIAYLESGGAEVPSREGVLEAIESVHTAIRAGDLDKIKSALRPPLPTSRPS